MIDLSQWRASVGLWNCCQSVSCSTRPATAENLKCNHRKLPLLFGALLLIVSTLYSCTDDAFSCFSSKARTVTIGIFQLSLKVSDILACFLYSVFVVKLLLLSGDVELNPGPVTGNSFELLQFYSDKLIDAISDDVLRVTNALYARSLVQSNIRRDVLAVDRTDYSKAIDLVFSIEAELESSINPSQYLADMCRVLLNIRLQNLTDIASTILIELGQSVPANSEYTRVSEDVQRYAGIVGQQYKHYPVVVTEWPPRIAKDYFGRIVLIDNQDYMKTQKMSLTPNEICDLHGKKEIAIKDILRSKNDLPLRIAVDGPPGIGKTSLCQKILNTWSLGELLGKKYDLLLYCPLKNAKVAKATTLKELFVCITHEVPMVAKWFEERNGEGLLILFDGWDEIDTDLIARQSTLAARIIRREYLEKCSVVITSRSYVSPSLLEMTSFNRYIQVIGFTEDEIATVIINTLQKDPKLAQELVEKRRESNNCPALIDSQTNNESRRALKLINELKVRADIQFLCTVPIILAIVILLFCKEGGRLPQTLTQLHQNFVLQTVRRHVKKYYYSIEPRQLYYFDHMPLVIRQPFYDICQVAYLSLKSKNKNKTFSFPLKPTSEKYDKGLVASFMECNEENHKFIHLNIQEFMAAWWIVNFENAEEVFKEHFEDNHFRMCLRFVAGLTQLEQASYRQYFDKLFVPQCKKRQLFPFENFQSFRSFRKDDHAVSSYDTLDDIPVVLLRLLYESQNSTLCTELAQSIYGDPFSKPTICFERVSLSLFDILCLSFFINNSGIKWSHFDLRKLSYHELSVFTAGLTDTPMKCERLSIVLGDRGCTESVHTFLQPAPLRNIQECHCELMSTLNSQYDPCLVLNELLRLPQLMILHFLIKPDDHSCSAEDQYSDLQKLLVKKSKLREMKVEYFGDPTMKEDVIFKLFSAIIRGVKENMTMTSLSLIIHDFILHDSILVDLVESLLINNRSLQTLELNFQIIPEHLSPSSQNILEVNTPLTALELGWNNNELFIPCFSNVRGLRCLTASGLLSPNLFSFYPNLQSLTLLLDSVEGVINLFNELQRNTTLEALKLNLKEEELCINDCDAEAFNVSMGNSLQDMLKQNRSLKYLEIMTDTYHSSITSNSFLSFLTTGLRHNTSLQQLSAPLPCNKDVNAFFNVIAQKSNITELKVDVRPEELYWESSEKEKEQSVSFCEVVLPAITTMLKSHTALRILHIKCTFVNELACQELYTKQVSCLYETIFIHPSLKCIEITGPHRPASFLKDIVKDQNRLPEVKRIAGQKESSMTLPIPALEPRPTELTQINVRKDLDRKIPVIQLPIKLLL
ncbi:PREDICTED: uncharacterized protein LOC109590916 [Amphimedon queenslandica]|uniref:NACHT domain-containing protein n=1 Tax=Amphimedon queenslandica TaxID=400682 RepID=A0A1X7VM61_AMPQE|nr:PREDICTED: uncharacterized protein LOC109590916 [Amphimedon queenslandica]|eukprot:XP_019862317.1 PREDICTED: uncharacterized protein LOC109590916 [Amphimedon queenslandica]